MDIGVGEKIESEKRTNERRENRFWKAAKIGIVAIGLAAAFGKSLKAEDAMKTSFIKEAGENGSVIEYEYNFSDDDTKSTVISSYNQGRNTNTNSSYGISLRTQGTVFGRTFFGIEGKLDKNKIDRKEEGSTQNGNWSRSASRITKESQSIFFNGGIGIAPDGVGNKIILRGGYCIVKENGENNSIGGFLHKDAGIYIGYDESGPMIIRGDLTNDSSNFEDVNSTYDGSKIGIQYLSSIGGMQIRPSVYFASLKGKLKLGIDSKDEYRIEGIVYCGPNENPCGIGEYSFGSEGHINTEINVNRKETEYKLPFIFGKNLVNIGYTKISTKYNDNSYYERGLQQKLNKIIEIYYAREMIKNVAAKIGYTHTLEKIIRTDETIEREDGTFKVGMRIKF